MIDRVNGTAPVTPFADYAHLVMVPGYVVFALGQNTWGRGGSAKTAIHQWRISAKPPFVIPGSIVKVTLIRASERSYLDDQGGICTPARDPQPEVMMEVTVRAPREGEVVL